MLKCCLLSFLTSSLSVNMNSRSSERDQFSVGFGRVTSRLDISESSPCSLVTHPDKTLKRHQTQFDLLATRGITTATSDFDWKKHRLPSRPLSPHRCAAGVPCDSAPELCLSWSRWGHGAEPRSGGNATEGPSRPPGGAGSPPSTPLSVDKDAWTPNMSRDVLLLFQSDRARVENGQVNVPPFVERFPCRLGWEWWKCDSCVRLCQFDSYCAGSSVPRRTNMDARRKCQRLAVG